MIYTPIFRTYGNGGLLHTLEAEVVRLHALAAGLGESADPAVRYLAERTRQHADLIAVTARALRDGVRG